MTSNTTCLASIFKPFTLLALLATGCVTSDDELDELATTEQAASWASFATRSINGTESGYSYSDPIGSDSGMSCFLAGVGGNLVHEWRYTTPYAGVFRSGGEWKIQSRPGDITAKVRTKALCLNTVKARTSPVEWTGGAAIAVASATANPKLRCFLSKVSALHTNYFPLDWAASTDKVHVWSDGLTWWIGGEGNAQGAAYCIEVQADVGGEYYWHGTTGDLAYNDQSPGTQCFLTGVRGKFRTDSYDSGVFINYDAGTNRFKMYAEGGKGGWARCIK